MHHRYPFQLTTMEEDFRAIGLLPERELTEEVELSEVDDPKNPRDIPSPDPSTLGGLDNSGGSINTKTRHATGQQPRPAIAPDEKDDHDDPLQAGATQKGRSAGGYNKKPNYREDRDYEEGMEQGPDPSHGYSQYKIVAKKPGMEPTDGKYADTGKNPDRAEGATPAKKIGGMYKESGAISRAAELMGEVEELLNGVQVDEEIHQLYRGFNLIGEDAALLADRLTEISDEYSVEHVVAAMEELSFHAIEMLDIVEAVEAFEKDKKKAIANGNWMPEEDEGEDIDLEDIKAVFQAMTLDLMDAVEAYDQVLGEKKDEEDDDDDDDEDEDKKGKLSTAEKMKLMRAKMKERSGK